MANQSSHEQQGDNSNDQLAFDLEGEPYICPGCGARELAHPLDDLCAICEAEDPTACVEVF